MALDRFQPTTLEERQETFWKQVDKEGPIPDFNPDLGQCWIWTGTKSGNYGIYACLRLCQAPHRWSYEWLVGEIPHGYQLDHLCRIPLCVNPAHLEPVTAAENMRRGRLGVLRHAELTDPPKTMGASVSTGVAAEMLSVHPKTVLNQIRKGHLDAFKLPSGKWRIYVASIQRWTGESNGS